METLGELILWGSVAGLLLLAVLFFAARYYANQHIAQCDICARTAPSRAGHYLPVGWTTIYDHNRECWWGVACDQCKRDGNIDRLVDYLQGAEQ